MCSNLTQWNGLQNRQLLPITLPLEAQFTEQPQGAIEIPIFYNIFVPAPPLKKLRALQIVQEQLELVNASSPPGHMIALYYNTLSGTDGDQSTTRNNTPDDVLVQQVVQEACRKFQWSTCQHLAHFPQGGSESITLTSLHTYCQSPNASSRVTYLHNKGSFHDNKEQTKWRQSLTIAALHPYCLNPPMPKSFNESEKTMNTCNVCALNFEPSWTQFFPGNMWTARCDYIQKLVSPNGTSSNNYNKKERLVNNANASGLAPGSPSPSFFSFVSYDYVQRRRDMGQWARASQPPRFTLYNFTHYLYPKRVKKTDYWGEERYGEEHWIGSHPDLVPCEMSSLNYRTTYGKNHKQIRFSFFMAPRGSLFTRPPKYLLSSTDKLIYKVIQDGPELRRYEYVLLAGSLYRWIGLYNQTPPYPSSWVWKFFPDAEFWHDQIPAIRSNLMQLLEQHQQQSRVLEQSQQ
ncbi:hypothetical protein ACA910_019102 [Epithemia clementina (nom. ined.)]